MTMQEALTSDGVLKWMPLVIVMMTIAGAAATGQFQLGALADDQKELAEEAKEIKARHTVDHSTNSRAITALELFIAEDRGMQSVAIQGIKKDIEHIQQTLDDKNEKLDRVLDFLIRNGGPPGTTLDAP